MMSKDEIKKDDSRSKYPRVIINADDFGITEGVSSAIGELVNAGVVTSTSVISNMPNFQAIKDLKDRVGIGVHFNLTVGKPVSHAKYVASLVNESGEFYELQDVIQEMLNGRVSAREVEDEFRLQIERVLDIGIQPDHVDSHESLLKYPFFENIIRRTARRYRIPAVRTYRPYAYDYTRLFSIMKIVKSMYIVYQYTRLKFDGFHVVDRYGSLLNKGLNYDDAIQSLSNIFSRLGDKTYEIAVHPGHCNGSERELGSYVHEREAEYHALKSDEFKNMLENYDVRLIRFSDLQK